MEIPHRGCERRDVFGRNTGREHRRQECLDQIARAEFGKVQCFSQTLVGRIGRQRTGPTCVGRHEGQRDGNRGVSVVERECERSAGRQTRDMGAVCGDRVHERGEAIGVSRHAPVLGRIGRLPRAGRVPSNHREVAGQFVDLSTPCRGPVTDEAVQQNEWRPGAGALVRDVETLNFDVIHWSHR